MKNLDPEKFRVKIWVPKNFGLQKNFDPEKVWVQKILSWKILCPEKIWVLKEFDFLKIWVPKNLHLPDTF